MSLSILANKRILLIVSGGIAACKCPELIRLLTANGAEVRCVLTRSGAEFVTPLTLSALSGKPVHQELLSLTEESEMGHIRLSRESDVILIAPATANLIAKMTHGLADDLATTTLLATDTPVMLAPSMNVRMWDHAATQSNIETLRARNIAIIGPEEGDMACGEYGMGRMSEPSEIVDALADFFRAQVVSGPLNGKRALVTSGPTYEAIDPVRYIANRSSGKQGHAIATALSRLGAETILVTGPTRQPDPDGIRVIHIQSARDMLAACEAALPVDIVVCAAAVADWRVTSEADEKLKKQDGKIPAGLSLTENPDILSTLSAAGDLRPALVVGFAAETEHVIDNATRKRASKGCDWICANDVSPSTGTFDGDSNTVHLITADGKESWPNLSKIEVGARLALRIAKQMEKTGE